MIDDSSMTAPVQMLLVEDSQDDSLLIMHRLRSNEEPIAMTRVDTAFALEEALEAKAWDIVVSDYHLPMLSGLAALEIVRRHDAEIPFILVSATVGEEVAVDAMRSGANDYVMKNKLARLLPAFQRELRESRSRRAGRVERDAQRSRIDRLAHFDLATGLANRASFEENLAVLVQDAAAKGAMLAVVVMQLDRHATISGVAGRHAGDEIVVQAAARVASLTHEPAAIARLDADLLAVVIRRVDANREAVYAFQQRMSIAFRAAFVLSACEYRLTPSLGIAIYPDDGTEVQILVRNAEAAAARAHAGSDPYLFYSRQMTVRDAERLALENRLRHALDRDEFVLHYQPKVGIPDGRIAGFEALIRWQSPELGLVHPDQFIPVLEETGLIVEVGAWVLRQAALDHRRWCERAANVPRIAVNVSVGQLRHRDFMSIVAEALAGTRASPAIDLEITESLLMENIEESIAKLAAIRELGVGISIDDFGTGHSSLAYLARLPVSALKIERLFIATMLTDPGGRKLVATMIDLAHSLGLKAIAEGVETAQQAEALRRLGCDEMQGYLVGRPAPWQETATLLAADGVRRREVSPVAPSRALP